jgi:hypothetical protein
VLVKKEAAASDPVLNPDSQLPTESEVPSKEGQEMVVANSDAEALKPTNEGGDSYDEKNTDTEEVAPDPNQKTGRKVQESRTHSRLMTDDPLIGLEH